MIERKVDKILTTLVILLFVSTSLAGSWKDTNQSTSEKVSKFKIGKLSEQFATARMETHEGRFSGTFQPTVVIDSPEDETTLYTRDVTIHGFAYASSPECKLTYWEWTWEWATGSTGNSSYISPPADMVEFWIDIHGLWLGANVITVTFYDACGFQGSDQITIYYEDIFSPTVVITYPEDGSEFDEPYITVQGHATDVEEHYGYGIGIVELSWHHTWEGGEEGDRQTFEAPVIEVTFSIPITLRPGENTIEVTAVDLAGNEGYDSVTVFYSTPDTEPPVVVKKYPPDGATFTKPNITAWGYVTDNIGIVSFGYTHEWEGGGTGSSWPLEEPTTNYSFEIPLTLREGWNRIRIEAWDAAGNYGYDEENVYYGRDTTPPVIEKTKPTGGIYIGDRLVIPFPIPVIIGSITIEVNVLDNESGVKKVEFYIDGQLQAGDATEPYRWKWGGTYLGLHTIRVVAYDNAGNYGIHEEKVIIMNLRGEATRIPQPVITSPVEKGAIGGMCRINVTEANNATDISYCRFNYFDGEEWVEIDTDYGYVVDAAIYRGEWFAWWDTSDLATGYYKLRVEMENTDGYIGYDEIEVYVEKPPVIVVDIIDYDPETGRTVFDASKSYDPDGEITNVYWTFWTYPNVTNMSGFRVEYVYHGNYTFSCLLYTSPSPRDRG